MNWDMNNNWQNTKIGEYFNVTNGKTNTDDAVVDGQYPLFDRSVLIKKSDKYLFDKEALIIPGEGKEFLPRYFLGKFDLHQRAYAIFTKDNSDVDIKYLYHWMNYRKDYLVQNAVGSTVKSLRLYMINDFPLLVPPTKTQQKIVSILSTIDNAVQKTDQVIEKTEKLKNGLMNDLLTKGRTMCIKEISEVKRGASPRPISDTKYFDISGRGWIRISDVTSTYKYLDKTTQYLSKEGENLSVKVDPGDLIMSICATVGKPVFVNIPSCIHDGFVLFRNINKLLIDPEFFFYSLLLNKDRIKSKGQTGSQMNINSTIVENTEIQIPELMKQKEIVNILRSTDKKLEVYSQELKRLKTLKNGLMNDIFSQKVEVLNA